MTISIKLAALASVALIAFAPAHAVSIPEGSSNLSFNAFDTTTRGTQLAFSTLSGNSSRISGTLRQAVYLNTNNTLDFYFQVFRNTQPVNVSQIGGLNVDMYTGFSVDGFADGTAPTGFAAPNNPPSAGQPAGSTTTVGRSIEGDVVNINFGSNRLDGTENSTVYILRTNATRFDMLGSATITDGASFNLPAFQPTAVPEPATWGMMLLGFGLIGASIRRSRRISTVLA